MQLHVRAAREGRAAQRHMLVEGLGRRLPPQQEHLGRGAVLVEGLDPVVVDLVIIPGAEPGRRGVAGLKVRVQLVLGVAPAIVVEAVDLAAEMLAGFSMVPPEPV